MIIDSTNLDNDGMGNWKANNDEGELRRAKLEEYHCEAELSLNVMSGVSNHPLWDWVGKSEVSILVNSDSDNFNNANIVRRIRLWRIVIEQFYGKDS